MEARLGPSANKEGFLSPFGQEDWGSVAVWLVVLWSCSRLEVLGKGNIFQSTVRDRTSQGNGLVWAGRVLENPCLFWEVFRMLRFWKTMVVLHNCCCFGEDWMGA